MGARAGSRQSRTSTFACKVEVPFLIPERCGFAMDMPEFDMPALADLAAAFRRRGKAIRHYGDLGVTREAEASQERLNVDYSGPSKLQLRFSVWSTGDWWFLACQPRPGREGGWLFKHELRGDVEDRAGDAFVKSFEDSMLLGYWSADERLAKLRGLWHVSRRRAGAGRP